MWSAGIGWSGDGFECAVVDRSGAPVGQRARFRQDGLAELTRFLLDLAGRAPAGTADGDRGDPATGESGSGLAVVIDSTNGLLDGSLMAAGLDLYRADPPVLPPRPAFGSVDAGALARVAPADRTRLSVDTGTIAGRDAETAAAITASAQVEQRLAAAGSFAEHGTRDRRELALSFDDGPDPRFTGAILDILADRGVPATFFCVGMNAAAHPGLVARAAGAAHLIGNHTFSHAYLPELGRDEVLRQVDATNDALAAVTGTRPALVRPPYGARTPQALEWLADHAMTTVLWDVDPADWSRPGTGKIVAAAVAAARAGSVLLMHDGGGERSQTVEALPAVIDGVLAAGYRIVALDRLLRPA
jgi:peptidoglycan/xylan/chitin deacetylase (PgdA/CDA1 family)